MILLWSDIQNMEVTHISVTVFYCIFVEIKLLEDFHLHKTSNEI